MQHQAPPTPPAQISCTVRFDPWAKRLLTYVSRCTGDSQSVLLQKCLLERWRHLFDTAMAPDEGPPVPDVLDLDAAKQIAIIDAWAEKRRKKTRQKWAAKQRAKARRQEARRQESGETP